MTALSLGRDADGPQQRILRGVHDSFAVALAGTLSSFLQSEIGAGLDTIATLSAADFHGAIKTPSCLINFQLEPLTEQAILSLDCAIVFQLLELLLGGTAGADPAAAAGETSAEPKELRNLTEIEWALLEDVVRVMVGALGEAWKQFHEVEFKVLSLESDPDRLPVPDPASQLVQLTFNLTFGEQSGSFQIAVPQTFFDVASNSVERQAIEPAAEDLQRNLTLLGEAKVDVEVLLSGPTMEFRELAGLAAGQVVQFNYPLKTPLKAIVNGVTSIPCQIISVGRKRAFQVEDLP